MNKDAEVLAKFFKWLGRKEKNSLNINQIAKKLGVKPDFIYKITAGYRKRPLPEDFLSKVKEVFYDETTEYFKNENIDPYTINRQRELNEKLSWANTQLSIELLEVNKELRSEREKNIELERTIEKLKRKIKRLENKK